MGVLSVLVTVVLSLLAAGWTGFVVYGDNIFEGYEEIECNTTFYDDVGRVREASGGLFIASLFVLGFGSIGIVLGIWEKTMLAEVPIMLGVIGILIGGILAFFVGLTGSCRYAAGNEGNGEVRDLQVFAGFVLGVGVLQALVTDVRRVGTGFVVASTTGVQIILWCVRLVAASYVTHIMTVSEKTFKEDYIPRAALMTAECQYALHNQTRLDSPEHKAYEWIELGKYHRNDTWTYNKNMQGLALSLLPLLMAELGTRVVEHGHEHGYLGWIPEGRVHEVSMWKLTTCLLQRITDISLALFAYSLVLANTLAACPSYRADTDNSHDFKGMYVTLVLFFGLTSLGIFCATTGNQITAFMFYELRHYGKGVVDGLEMGLM